MSPCHGSQTGWRNDCSRENLVYSCPCLLAARRLQAPDKDGERGRNRTFNLLIKSYVFLARSYGEKRSMGFRILSFLPSFLLFKLRDLNSSPMGLSPTVHASLRWTHTSRYQSGQLPQSAFLSTIVVVTSTTLMSNPEVIIRKLRNR